MKTITLFQALFKMVCLSALMLLPMSYVQAQRPVDTPLVNAAEKVLGNYFNALKNGDLSAIRNVLGPELLRRREGLLSNPDYSNKLMEIHKDVKYTMTGHRLNNNNTLAVFVDVTTNNAKSRKYQFTMENIDQKGLCIIKENEIL